LRHIVWCYFMRHHVIHCHVMSRPTTSFHNAPCHFKQDLIMLCQATLHLGVSRAPSYRNVVYFVSCFCLHSTSESSSCVMWSRPFDFKIILSCPLEKEFRKIIQTYSVGWILTIANKKYQLLVLAITVLELLTNLANNRVNCLSNVANKK